MTGLFRLKGKKHMENAKEEIIQEEEEDCKPLTDEEFAEFQKEEARKEKKIIGIFEAIWDTITVFFT